MAYKWMGWAMAAALAAGGVTSAAQAQDAGPWQVRVGAHNVDPKSDNGTLAGANATVSSSTRPTFNVDYYLTPNWAVDLLAAVPFKHDISLNGSKVASTKQLPPTLSLQYHFLPAGQFDPFLGLGVNYTRFFGTDSGLGSLKLDDSWGVAAQAGVDYRIGNGWAVGADLRWMQIRTRAHLNGADIGKATIDPLAFGMTLAKRF